MQNEKEFIDETAERVAHLISNNRPIRSIRKSQVLSALLGAIGFALFIDGVLKLFANFPAWGSFLLGFLMMSATGLLLKNLHR